MNITLNEINYQVDDRLKNFTIEQKPSSNVAFFALNGPAMQLFVQFKSGQCYLYDAVDLTTQKELINAESIGKFVANRIVKHFPSQNLGENLVKMLDRQKVLLRKDIMSGKMKPYGRKHDEVFVLSESNGTLLVESVKTGDRFPVSADNVLRPAKS